MTMAPSKKRTKLLLSSSSSSSLGPNSRRSRERSKLSFLFVIFFFGLFSLIIVMESLMTDGNKSRMFKDGDSDFTISDSSSEDYSNWDISYEESPPQGPSSSMIMKTQTQTQTQGPAKPTSSSPANTRTKTVEPDWQKVVGTKEKFFVYSAYHNSFFEHIRIIGATRTKSLQHVFCRFYDNDTRVYATVNATIRTIRENWNLKYSACFILCYIPNDRNKQPPRYVSLMSSSSPSASPSNILRVQYPHEKRELSPINFSACVKPIHFNYDNILPFLEWMEFYRLMGVSRFIFYNHTIGPGVAKVLREYEDEVEILPWSLPFISQKEIRTEGLFAALNDCVYRSRGASKYLVLVDLDEMIVPRKSANYSMLLDKLDTLSNKKKIGAYSFQNGFFYLQWPDDQSQFKIEGNPLAERVSKKLLTLKKTRRRSRLHPHKQRSKYICDPEKVVEAGNHFVWEMAPGYFTLSVPPHLGTLHHYRICEFGGDQCTKSPYVVDKSSHNFGQDLAIRVASKLEILASKFKDLDIDHIINSQQTVHGDSSSNSKDKDKDKDKTTSSVKKPLGL